MLNTISIEDEDVLDARKSRKASPVDRKIGSMLRVQRMARRVSQEALAEMCGISFQQIQKYETGQNRLSLGRFIHMSRCLGFDTFEFINDFLSGDDKTDNAAALVNVQLGTRGAFDLLDAFATMAYDDRSAILNLARRFARDAK